MNKMLVAIFDTETAAEAGLQALRKLHGEGDITMYAAGVIVKDHEGKVVVRKALDHGAGGAGVGLAVGSLIGMLGGPVGLAVGAVTGTVAGAVRDFWITGVGMDFVEQAGKLMQPAKAALVAEVEEEWVLPVDTALSAAGGLVLRRTRAELAEAQFDHDIAACKSEIQELEDEASQAGDAAKVKLESSLQVARTGLQAAVERARWHVDMLRLEADAKAESLKSQLSGAGVHARARIEERVKRVKSAYHARGAKLTQAWALTREALSV
ncbi:MAG: DUF1269 domain-containing protein [Ramlibacter sp.]